MSYIVAFVTYTDESREFPVQCFRPDLREKDAVIVRRSDGELRNATISRLRYLNWDCKGRIECKVSECSLDRDGNIILPYGSPIAFGMLTPGAVINALRDNGWVPVKPRQRIFKAVLANVNNSHVGYIFVRKNGVDLLIIPSPAPAKPKPFSTYDRSWKEGKGVNHFLAHTTFNLYEGILRFSNSFLNNEDGFDRYFVPQGLSDKRTEELKEQARNRKESKNEMLDIYDACSGGDGGPAYLGDGVWVTSDGVLHDWGR